MSILLRRLMSPYMAPAGEADGGGGAVDRGDDFVPTDDTTTEEPEAKKEPVKAETPPAEETDVDPEDPDAGEGEPAAEEKKPAKKDSRIPLARHKEILEKERAERERLETELAQYRQGKEVAKINDQLDAAEKALIDLEGQYNKALADGRIDEATKLMREIRTQERAIVETKADQRLQIATAQAIEQSRYDATLERVEEAYPQINPDSDEFDREVLKEVVEWKAFNEAQRKMTPAKALQAAVKKVLGTETKKQAAATEVTARVDEAAAEEAAAKKVAAERKKAAVDKALGTKQPPATSKVGQDHDKAGGGFTAKDVMKMSPEEFSKLPADILSKMRGDLIA